MSRQIKSYIYALSAIILWSTVATAFKFSLEQYDFIQVLFISSATASFVLLLINIFQNNFKSINNNNKKEIVKSILSGILNPFIYYLVLFKAYDLLPAQMAQSLNYTWPIVLVIFTAIIYKYKLKLKTYLSLLFGFLGVIIISFKGNFNIPTDISTIGLILAAGSSIIWASFWIINSRIKLKNEMKLFISFFMGFLLISLALFIFSELPKYESKAFLSAIYSGLFEMSITFILWNKALELTKRTENISNIIFLSPFISLFFISVFLNEAILVSTYIGLSTIVLGIFIEKFKPISKN